MHARDFFARIPVFASPASPASPLRIWGKSTSAKKTAPEPTKYHEWNPIEETIVAGSTTEKKNYVWGNDLSGNLHGAGGVGGLLSMKYNGDSYFYAFDGNGNARALVKADAVNPAASAITARYAYDGFGKEVAVSGADADKNAFRFSTKQLDAETGMNYYGYRYYAADAGRWINRDPIAENGGLNVYAMVANEVVRRWDKLGHCSSYQESIIEGAKAAASKAIMKALRELDYADYDTDLKLLGATPCDKLCPSKLPQARGLYKQFIDKAKDRLNGIEDKIFSVDSNCEAGFDPFCVDAYAYVMPPIQPNTINWCSSCFSKSVSSEQLGTTLAHELSHLVYGTSDKTDVIPKTITGTLDSLDSAYGIEALLTNRSLLLRASLTAICEELNKK